MLIADESHMLKNIDSKRTQTARRFALQVFFLLFITLGVELSDTKVYEP